MMQQRSMISFSTTTSMTRVLVVVTVVVSTVVLGFLPGQVSGFTPRTTSTVTTQRSSMFVPFHPAKAVVPTRPPSVATMAAASRMVALRSMADDENDKAVSTESSKISADGTFYDDEVRMLILKVFAVVISLIHASCLYPNPLHVLFVISLVLFSNFLCGIFLYLWWIGRFSSKEKWYLRFDASTSHGGSIHRFKFWRKTNECYLVHLSRCCRLGRPWRFWYLILEIIVQRNSIYFHGKENLGLIWFLAEKRWTFWFHSYTFWWQLCSNFYGFGRRRFTEVEMQDAGGVAFEKLSISYRQRQRDTCTRTSTNIHTIFVGRKMESWLEWNGKLNLM